MAGRRGRQRPGPGHGPGTFRLARGAEPPGLAFSRDEGGHQGDDRRQRQGHRRGEPRGTGHGPPLGPGRGAGQGGAGPGLNRAGMPPG